MTTQIEKNALLKQFEICLEETINTTGVSREDILSSKRQYYIVKARHIARWVTTKAVPQASLLSIGFFYKHDDHSTVIYARNKVENWNGYYPDDWDLANSILAQAEYRIEAFKSEMIASSAKVLNMRPEIPVMVKHFEAVKLTDETMRQITYLLKEENAVARIVGNNEMSKREFISSILASAVKYRFVDRQDQIQAENKAQTAF